MKLNVALTDTPDTRFPHPMGVLGGRYEGGGRRGDTAEFRWYVVDPWCLRLCYNDCGLRNFSVYGDSFYLVGTCLLIIVNILGVLYQIYTDK